MRGAERWVIIDCALANELDNAMAKTQTKTTAGKRPRSGQWDQYLDAELGFRNHWYPALFSRDVSETQVTALTLLGEDILLKRLLSLVL